MSNILNTVMGENDIDAETVGDYLKELLITILHEQEGFSGKRPFGNSGWIHELAFPLVKAKLVEGTLADEEHEDTIYCDDWNEDELIAVLSEAINELFESAK